ncbi:MAG: hypothetical protein BWY89_02071 [Bacteroidetes bacterium ADurb.BinA012]|nr:MAG: hypothetical protein BWY89_02071 [Bacteroidetes bacterium ADurb.BinA012]
MTKPGGYIPVYVADVITNLVFAHLAEGHSPATESTVIFTCKDLAGQPARPDLNLPYLL